MHACIQVQTLEAQYALYICLFTAKHVVTQEWMENALKLFIWKHAAL